MGLRHLARLAGIAQRVQSTRGGGIVSDLPGSWQQAWSGVSTAFRLEQHRFASYDSDDRRVRHTTVLCVRKDNTVVIMADGQVTLGSQIIKPNVKKVRRIADGVIGGFAGTTADAFTLFERLENKLDENQGQVRTLFSLIRAAVDLAKAWRTDKYLRKLDAVMVVADKDVSLTITGNGDVLEPHDGVIGIGSGGPYALSAARALIDIPGMDAEAIARKSMTIAADVCIYTNHNFVTETIVKGERPSPAPTSSQAAQEAVKGVTEPTAESDSDKVDIESLGEEPFKSRTGSSRIGTTFMIDL
ncbi:hypothetical protein KFL_000030270 [Klebsormidium nitens]|uniref:Uncharacterized protein n=1 Tax=Klebsormidium nitens TaxID=105231 RepID=A0A1Y1HPK0_KLENI|nr:hypothetical protein KFL_000030270 [Klebsormidium nitens]|eukprot:GAQ77748.1 hypothetical protein KFL_000030270 [Klebsormidium nitens]